MRRLIVLLAALAMVLAACGDDDGSGGLSTEEQAVAAAIAADASAGSEAGDPFSDPEAAQCMAEGVVKDIGMERLAEIGVTAESADQEQAFANMTDTEIDVVISYTLDCVDIEAVMAEQMEAQGLDAETAQCFADEFDEDFYRVAFRTTLTGGEFDPTADPAVADSFMAAFTKCLGGEG